MVIERQILSCSLYFWFHIFLVNIFLMPHHLSSLSSSSSSSRIFCFACRYINHYIPNMATTLTPSPNTKHWWPRITAGRLNHHNDQEHLFTALNIGGRPQTSSGTSRSAWMVPVMNLSSTSFSSSNKSSRFNLAAVFGSKSKRRHPVDIQDPPSHIRSLPDTHSDPTRRLSRAVTSTSGASTDAPLTPSDPPPSFGLTDLTDPFISTSPLSDRRSSTHSDKSLSKRLIHTKTTKSITRLPVGEPSPKRRESRDRSSTLPSRAKCVYSFTIPPIF